MIKDTQFCGSNGIKQQLESLLLAGSLPHAILLCGEAGTGRNLLARLIASAYLADENELVLRHVHPDCIEIRGTGASGMIPVDAVRDASFEVNKSPVMADGRRVVIIEDAANLNRSSSAALLKTLEQPPAGVVFLVTVSSVFDVIDTVRSRCVVMNLVPPSPEQCAAYLKKIRNESEYARIEMLSRLFRGRIGLVLRGLDDEGFKETLERAERFSKAVLKENEIAMLSSLDAAENRQKLFELLEVSVFWLAESGSAAGPIRLIEEMKGDLSKNVSPKLFSTMLVVRLMEKPA